MIVEQSREENLRVSLVQVSKGKERERESKIIWNLEINMGLVDRLLWTAVGIYSTVGIFSWILAFKGE